jgi:guanylate kinase
MNTEIKNHLYIVSGNSGSGKTTLFRQLMGAHREIVSVTSRPIREGEVEGVDYYFTSPDIFEEYIARGVLAEYVCYDGNYYGAKKEEFKRKLSGGDAFIIVEFDGHKRVKEEFPWSTTVFLYNTAKEAAIAMRVRGDSEAKIMSRLSLYEYEVKNGLEHYDFALYNKFGFREHTLKMLHLIVN